MTDTRKAWQSIPLFQYEDFDSFMKSFPKGASLTGIELSSKSKPLSQFKHPLRGIYLLGAEDDGLPIEIQRKCDHIVEISGASFCLNVSVSGSIVIYDRLAKLEAGDFDSLGPKKMR